VLFQTEQLALILVEIFSVPRVVVPPEPERSDALEEIPVFGPNERYEQTGDVTWTRCVS
jgi:hypothetical protein